MHKYTLIALLWALSLLGFAQNPPIQYEPIMNAVCEDTVHFDWKRVPLAASYTIQISTDSLFSITIIDQTQPENHFVWANTVQGRYYWRVKANNTAWSAVRRVSILKIQQLPGLLFRMMPERNITVSGGLVSSWGDVTPNALQMTQTNPSLMPTFVEQGINGRPALQYGKAGTTGNQTSLTFPSISLTGGNFSFFTAYVQTGNGLAVQHLMSSTSQRGLICGGTFGSGYNATIFDGTNLYRSNPTTSYLSWNVIAYRKTGIRRNGAALPMTGVQPNTFPITTVGLDVAFPTTNFFYGKMGEMILTNTVLSDSLTMLVERYLVTKYSRVARLPVDTEACNTSINISIGGLVSDYQNITWSNGASNVTSLSLTNNGTYWVTATSWFGVQTRDTFTVTGLRPKPVMNILTNQNICKNRDTVQFFVANAISGQVYSWNTGEVGDTIHVTNENEVYLIQTDPQSSCSFYSDTVYITHKTKADFANPAACPGVSANFLNLSSDYNGDTLVSWYWTYGDPLTTLDFSTDTNGAWIYPISGTYPVFLKVTTSDGCSDSVVKNVTIKPTAIPNFNWQGLCYGKPTQFFDQSTPGAGTQVTGYQWTFKPGVTSSFVNPAVVYDTAGIYPVSLKIFTASGCNETVTLQVPVNKGVDAAFSISDSLCSKQNVDAVDLSNGINDNITSWVWRFGNNAPISAQAPTYAFQNTGNRIVRLTVKTSAGCTDSTQQTVFVKSAADANFTLAVNGGNPPFVPQVTNLTTGAVSYTWNINGTIFSNDFEPTFPSYSDTGIYQVTLVVTNSEGCSDQTSKNFVVFTGDRTLQLLSATCVPEGDFMKYTARVFNKGALEVNQITFGANTDYNSVIKENWTGLLMPGQILDYSLKSQSKYYTSADFCCVRIDNFNDTLSVKSPDDEICLPLTSGTWVSQAYPTPSGGIITIDHIFPYADKFSATLSGMDGKLVRELFTNRPVNAGFGSFTVDISDVKAGMYVIRITYRDRAFSVKVIKR